MILKREKRIEEQNKRNQKFENILSEQQKKIDDKSKYNDEQAEKIQELIHIKCQLLNKQS